MAIAEDEIRPQDLMAGLAVEVEKDRQWLIDRRDHFVPANCPVCDQPGVHEFVKKEFNYERCPDCRTVFVNPRPSEGLLHEFYEQSRTYAYWNQHIFPASEEVRREKIFAPRAQRVLGFCDHYAVEKGTLLEIGAGFGTFCQEIQQRELFDRVIALEMTPGLAETCRQRGLEVLEQPVEHLEFPEHSVNLVAAFETLEHLYDPKSFLQACHRLLASKGLLVITCPSIDGFDVTVLGEHSDTIDHEHLNYLNPSSIRQLATDVGFRVLEVQTPGQLDADIVRNKVLQDVVSLDNQPWLKQILLDRWDDLGQDFQNFLASNQLSTHMWMVATVD